MDDVITIDSWRRAQAAELIRTIRTIASTQTDQTDAAMALLAQLEEVFGGVYSDLQILEAIENDHIGLFPLIEDNIRGQWEIIRCFSVIIRPVPIPC